MQKKKNEFWAFFASVKLALFTFFILAVTSVIGTLIPQGKEMQFYVDAFGPGTAKLFQILNVPDMSPLPACKDFAKVFGLLDFQNRRRLQGGAV